MAGLYESMKMGMETLHWSADIAMPDEKNKPKSRISDFFSSLFAIALAISLFMIAPMWLTTNLLPVEKDAILFNLASGFIRIFFFILYLFLISRMNDVKRLFQYHGAEHRVVYNFESGKKISVKNAQLFPTQHPRCGTSFMFIVLLSAIIVFSIIDSFIMMFTGNITLVSRLLFHLPMIPIVAGISYELIKISSRNDNLFFRILRTPGLWLQNITTRQPDDEMVEVAIHAIEKAFGKKLYSMSGKQYVAEAVG